MIAKCPSCSSEFEVGPELEGKHGRCSSCGRTFLLPETPGRDAREETVTQRRPSGMSSFVALLLAIAFGVGAWALFKYVPLAKGAESALSMDALGGWLPALGNFHPLILHLPIGLLLVTGLLEFFSTKGRRAVLAPAITTLLWLTAISSIFAVASGWLMAKNGNGSGVLLDRHMWLAIVLTGLILLTLMFRVARERKGRGLGSLFFYRLGLLLSIALLGLTAHQGGSMVYGSDHLTDNLPQPARKFALKGEQLMETGFAEVGLADEKRATELAARIASADSASDSGNVEEKADGVDDSDVSVGAKVAGGAAVSAVAVAGAKAAAASGEPQPTATKEGVSAPSAEATEVVSAEEVVVVSEIAQDGTVFNEVVLPILEAKCNQCHSDKKSKGKLKMHTFDHLMTKDDTVVPGDLEASLLSFRIGLPIEDDEAMPPEDEEPLTKDEVAILNWWIASGASAETKVADANVPEDLKASFLAVTTPTAAAPVAVVEEVAAVVPAVVYSKDEIDAASKLIRENIGASLMPVYSGAETLQFTALNVIKDFGDEQLAKLEPLSGQLEEVNLARTKITDGGLRALSGMAKLKRLHLENTEVTDVGLEHLANLQSLEYLNLYGTNVTDDGLRTLLELPALKKVYAWESGITRKAAESVAWLKPELEVNVGWDDGAAAVAKSTEGSKSVAEPANKPAEAKSPEPAPAKPAPKKKQPKAESKKAAPAKPTPAKPEAKKEAPAKPAPATKPKVEQKKPATPAKPNSAAKANKSGPIGAAPQAKTANRACLVTRKPVDPKFTVKHNGLHLGFADKASLETFQKNPEAFAVQIKLLQNR